MGALVWVDAWQMQCFGEPFRVGEQVEWTLLSEPDLEWLRNAIDPEVAMDIEYAEEHHGGLSDDAPITRGTVLNIRASHCRYAPAPGDSKTLYPVPGSGQLRQVDRAHGWEAHTEDLRFNGYLVELDSATTDA